MRAHLLGGEDLLPTIAAGAQMIKGIFKFQTQRPSHLSPLLPVRNRKCQMFRYDPVSRFATLLIACILALAVATSTYAIELIMTLGKSNVKAVNANTVEKLSCGCQTVSSQHKNTCTPMRIAAHSTRLTTPEDILSSSMGAHVARIAATMLTQVIQIAVMCSVTKFRMGLLPCDKRRHTASPTTNKTITAESRSTRFMDKRSTGDQDSIS